MHYKILRDHFGDSIRITVGPNLVEPAMHKSLVLFRHNASLVECPTNFSLSCVQLTELDKNECVVSPTIDKLKFVGHQSPITPRSSSRFIIRRQSASRNGQIERIDSMSQTPFIRDKINPS